MIDSQPFPISNERELDFTKADTFYATHRLHSFSAKFPPQLPDWGLDHFSKPGDWVLDPFAGSGTLLVEARLKGRNSLGVDIDPLAQLMSKVKSTPMPPKFLEKQCLAFVSELSLLKVELKRARQADSTDDLLQTHNAYIPNFPNRDYWFLRSVQEELALLKALINHQPEKDFKDFLFVVFSSIIVTKGKTSVANVRDLAHSRPHYAEPEEIPDTFGLFEFRLERAKSSLVEFAKNCDDTVQAQIIGDDARQIPLPDNSIDLVFTSPPYVNAIDYPRAHKFSVFWLPEFFHMTSNMYTDLGRQYIGTDRVPLSECKSWVERGSGLKFLDSTIARIAESDIKKAGVTAHYFNDMQASIREMCRVLRAEKTAIIVVSPSNIKEIEVETHQILALIAEQIEIPDRSTGRNSTFKTEEIALRVLDDSKRQLPYLRGNNGTGMRNEYVIVLRKTAR